MASFFEELWKSIFAESPTPTLLVATNVTFAALQLVLGGLLFATNSVHFYILSFLSGGLWLSINWFAAEVIAGNEKEAEAKRLRAEKDGSGDDSGTETESVGGDAQVASGVNLEVNEDLKKRRSLGEVSGTDSEWDKVESEVSEVEADS